MQVFALVRVLFSDSVVLQQVRWTKRTPAQRTSATACVSQVIVGRAVWSARSSESSGLPVVSRLHADHRTSVAARFPTVSGDVLVAVAPNAPLFHTYAVDPAVFLPLVAASKKPPNKGVDSTRYSFPVTFHWLFLFLRAHHSQRSAHNDGTGDVVRILSSSGQSFRRLRCYSVGLDFRRTCHGSRTTSGLGTSRRHRAPRSRSGSVSRDTRKPNTALHGTPRSVHLEAEI